MGELTAEQTVFAVARLAGCMEARKWSQTTLEKESGISQSTISKILKHDMRPSEEVLKKLFKQFGLKLSNILNDYDAISDEILGYLATPLTGLTESADREVRRVVEQIQNIAAELTSDAVPFQLYWPGERTHPKQHADFPAKNVYVFDRSRASTYDFIILLCGAPSYGVGQENEIATQAVVPAIRLMPKTGMSRMMTGSFIQAIDIHYDGTLESGISFEPKRLQEALASIRIAYFRQKAQTRSADTRKVGERLADLIAHRCSNKLQLALDVGISQDYLDVLLSEPFAVANPSAVILSRIASRLDVKVSYLLGESDDADLVWVESNVAWRKWIDESVVIDAKQALKVRDEWRASYKEALRGVALTTTSHRAHGPQRVAMSVVDWERAYKKLRGEKNKPTSQESLFG